MIKSCGLKSGSWLPPGHILTYSLKYSTELTSICMCDHLGCTDENNATKRFIGYSDIPAIVFYQYFVHYCHLLHFIFNPCTDAVPLTYRKADSQFWPLWGSTSKCSNHSTALLQFSISALYIQAVISYRLKVQSHFFYLSAMADHRWVPTPIRVEVIVSYTIPISLDTR